MAIQKFTGQQPYYCDSQNKFLTAWFFVLALIVARLQIQTTVALAVFRKR